MEPTQTPTLYEWVGGIERLEALFMKFYDRVPADPILGPVFAAMPSDHFRTVAHFVAEVLGGPRLSRHSKKRCAHCPEVEPPSAPGKSAGT